jgi:hypothetical protein
MFVTTRYRDHHGYSIKYCCIILIVNKSTTKILSTYQKTMNMSNEMLAFFYIVTAFSLFNISSAEALPPADRVNGQGSAGVGSSNSGANRNFSAGSKASASSPSNATTTSNSNLITNPTKLETGASSSSKAGGQLQGNGSATSTLTGSPNLMTAVNRSSATVTGATTGAASAGLSSSLNSSTGVSSANSNYNYSGGK